MNNMYLYIDKNGLLTLQNGDSSIKESIGGYALKELFETRMTGKILKAEFVNDNKDLYIQYDNSSLTIINYNSIAINSKYNDSFQPLMHRVVEFKEKENLKKSKKKVERQNKHIKCAISVGAFSLAAVCLFGTVKGFNKDKTKNETIPVLTPTPISDEIGYKDEEMPIIKYTHEVYPYKAEEKEEPTAHIEYEDKTDSYEANLVREKYLDLIKKYSEMYGLDYKLVAAIATRERGIHSETIDENGAIGLMQVQVGSWANDYLSAYNFITQEKDTMFIDEASLSNVEYNIKVGCRILQYCLKRFNYNILASLQAYNMGDGDMDKILTNYCLENNKSREEVLSDQNNTEWMNYRYLASGGDQEYVENVLAYLGEQIEINMVSPDGQTYTLRVNNIKKGKML